MVFSGLGSGRAIGNPYFQPDGGSIIRTVFSFAFVIIFSLMVTIIILSETSHVTVLYFECRILLLEGEYFPHGFSIGGVFKPLNDSGLVDNKHYMTVG
jgi:hypothetical protein